MINKTNPLYNALRKSYDKKTEAECWDAEYRFVTPTIEVDDAKYTHRIVAQHIAFGMDLIEYGIDISEILPNNVAEGKSGMCPKRYTCCNPNHFKAYPANLAPILHLIIDDSSNIEKIIKQSIEDKILPLTNKVIESPLSTADLEELESLIFMHKSINHLM